MHAFTMHPSKPAPDDGEKKPRRRWRWLLALLFLFGVAGVVWAVRPNPHLTRAQQLQKELFGPNAKNLPPDQRKAMFAEYRNEVKQLSDDQKWALSAPMREKQQAELDRYFAMTPQQKTKYLDERIDRMEKAKKDREKNGARPGGPGGGPGSGPGGGPPGGFAFGGGPPGTKGGTPPSPEEIEKRKKQFLERTTP